MTLLVIAFAIGFVFTNVVVFELKESVSSLSSLLLLGFCIFSFYPFLLTIASTIWFTSPKSFVFGINLSSLSIVGENFMSGLYLLSLLRLSNILVSFDLMLYSSFCFLSLRRNSTGLLGRMYVVKWGCVCL